VRGVLGLFEGVVTDAADAYRRIAEKLAATLLHLVRVSNGLASLVNARRPPTPTVKLVGRSDHAAGGEDDDRGVVVELVGVGDS
jgi:thiamine pyrophosphate-dependent acetolactate synthase large subunit-like protein